MHSWLRLPITGGSTIIELRDLPTFQAYRWHRNDAGYVVNRSLVLEGKKITLRLHRLIAHTPEGLDTDHLNHDRADNRRSNLMPKTRSENLKNASLSRWGQAALNAARTTCSRGHEYTGTSMYLYRGERVCRIAERARNKANEGA
jgi:hypothetical protein